MDVIEKYVQKILLSNNQEILKIQIFINNIIWKILLKGKSIHGTQIY